VLFGTVWQAVLAFSSGLKSMDRFLATKNNLFLEERARIRSEVSGWRIVRRRRLIREMGRELGHVLTSEELERENAYLRQGIGWAAIVAGTLIGAVVAWLQVHA